MASSVPLLANDPIAVYTDKDVSHVTSQKPCILLVKLEVAALVAIIKGNRTIDVPILEKCLLYSLLILFFNFFS